MYIFRKFKRLYLSLLAREHKNYLVRNSRKISPDLKVNGDIEVVNPEALTVCENVHIGHGCYFHCDGSLKIGAHTHISRRVKIYTSDHDYESELIPYSAERTKRSVTIGAAVWVGMDVIILKGVAIGDGAIIASGSIVTKDVGRCQIVAGNPARTIGQRNAEAFDRKLKDGKCGGVNGRPYGNG